MAMKSSFDLNVVNRHMLCMEKRVECTPVFRNKPFYQKFRSVRSIGAHKGKLIVTFRANLVVDECILHAYVTMEYLLIIN